MFFLLKSSKKYKSMEGLAEVFDGNMFIYSFIGAADLSVHLQNQFLFGSYPPYIRLVHIYNY